MTEQSWKEILESEGFKDIYIWQDKAGTEYPDHPHDKLTVHVILEGDMELMDHRHKKALKAGDRFDIPAGTVHSAKIGLSGCRYMVGEK